MIKMIRNLEVFSDPEKPCFENNKHMLRQMLKAGSKQNGTLKRNIKNIKNY